jgi:hypothetical protein
MTKTRRGRPPRNDAPPGVKMIAVYGHYTARVNVLERVLKTRVDGVKQHYWMRSGKTEIKSETGRFEFYGTGRELAQAVSMMDHLVPKNRFQVVSARDFIRNPWRYSIYGYWLEKDVQS